MYEVVRHELAQELDRLHAGGTYNDERVIRSAQGPAVLVGDRELVNLCSNNYLGLAGHPEVVAAAREALEAWGFGLASVWFICGTQTIHKQLEERLSGFLGTDDTVPTARASTPTPGSSRRCSGRTTSSSPTGSTTPRSSTAFGSAAHGACATRTATSTSWNGACARQPAPGGG